MTDPYMAGRLHWNAATLTLKPQEPLEAGVTYTVTFSDDVRSEQGRPIESVRPWQFAARWRIAPGCHHRKTGNLAVLTGHEEH